MLPIGKIGIVFNAIVDTRLRDASLIDGLL